MKQDTALQQFLSELHSRLVTINSEPNGIVRETMIQNFLIGELDYLKLEKQQIVDAYNQDLYGGLSSNRKFEDGAEYYTQTFNPL